MSAALSAAKRLVPLALALAACGKGGDPNPLAGTAKAMLGSATPSNVARDALISSWKSNGLDTSAFAVAQSPIGKDCEAGTVNKIDVQICAFGSADEANAAQNAGLKWIGDTTGTSQAKGTLLIAVADRAKSDPNGRTINQMMKLAK